MQPTDDDVETFLATVQGERRRAEARTMLDLMARVTGLDPVMWGSIVGYGSYHYRYASGREGDAPVSGFSPRKAAMTVYLAPPMDRYAAQLARLGPHTSTVSCLYITRLEDVDLGVLEEIARRSHEVSSAAGYGTTGGG